MLRRGAFALFLVLCLPGVAHAGTYDVTTCGSDLVNRAWIFERYSMFGRELSDPSAFVSPTDLARCGAEDGISLVSRDETGVKRQVRTGEGGAFVFRAPAGTSIRTVQMWRNAVVRESTDDPATPIAEDGVWTYVARTGDAFPPVGAIADETCPGNVHNADGTYCRRGNAPRSSVVPVSYAVRASVLAVGIECQGDPSKWCFTNTGAVGAGNAGLNLQRAIVTVDDPVAPGVGVDVPDSAFRQPDAALTAFGSDSAGVASIRVAVDGAERTTLRFACDYALAAPCPAAPASAFSLDGVADGRHVLALTATDAAGNAGSVERVVNVDGTPPEVSSVDVRGRVVSAVVTDGASGVEGGTISARPGRDGAYTPLATALRGGRLVATLPAAMSPSRAGLSVSVSDRAGNVRSGAVTSMSLTTAAPQVRVVRGGRATIRPGRPVLVSGRLTLSDGTLLAAQSLTVTAKARVPGAPDRLLGTPSTDASGRFWIRIPAGPSQDVTVRFAGTEALVGRTRAVSLRVPATSTIRASSRVVSGAASVRFSGRLRTLGASIPPGGKIVELQARAGGRWSTVATTRARPSWRAVARFRGTPGRYPVRLRIRREAAFGYELGYSPSVVVTVR